MTNPNYPVYIVSKGRADTRLTSRSLERMNVPYFIAVEPQEYEQYAAVINPNKIITLPFSNHGKGPGPARNFCWDHSISLGAKKHWVLDDNISDFYRLHNNERIRVETGAIFCAAEDFVDRYENIPISGFQYRFFIAPNGKRPAYITNTRIYSCLLIENICQHRWRGKYNEDTDLCLRVLKDTTGPYRYCTVQFNAFLQGKAATQTLKGGNTEEFYHKEGTLDKSKWRDGKMNAEGTLNKSKMLYDLHPDVAEIVIKYGRWHHYINYNKHFKQKLILKKNVNLNKFPKINNYGMKLTTNFSAKSLKNKDDLVIDNMGVV